MELSLRTRALEALRRYRPLYASFRAFYRLSRRLPREAVRKVVPRTQAWGLPFGFYSGVEEVRSGRRAGRVFADAQAVPEFGEHTLVRLSRLGQDENQPWPVFWLHEKDAYLSGETLCLRDRQGRLMAESTFSQAGSPGDPAYGYFATSRGERLEGNVTSLVSFWGNRGYWHWLMDGVSRLALLPEFPTDTRIVVPPLKSWQKWFLAQMGLAERLIETKEKALTVENYYFASPSSMTGCYNPIAFHFLRKQFLSKAAPSGGRPKRFYIVREGFTRGVRNEKEVRAFFERRGWGLVAPETLPIPDQIALFAEAEAIVGLHGSALTNLLWCNPSCRVVELNSDNFLLGSFEIIARVLGLYHDFLICPGDHRSFIQVDLVALAEKLDRAVV